MKIESARSKARRVRSGDNRDREAPAETGCVSAVDLLMLQRESRVRVELCRRSACERSPGQTSDEGRAAGRRPSASRRRKKRSGIALGAIFHTLRGRSSWPPESRRYREGCGRQRQSKLPPTNRAL